MLRKLFNSIQPKLEKGKPLHFLKSTVEAFESFAFVSNKVTQMGAHVRDSIDSKRAMLMVMIALVPAMLFGMWNVGYQHFLSYGLTQGIWNNFCWGFLKVMPIIVVTYVVGLGIEFTVAQWRGEEVNEGFLVTGLLIPMLCPPEIPLWIVAVATAFAVIIGKEIFGGTGMNIWNPALLVRAFMFFSYPSMMSGDAVWIAEKADAFSGATPLAQVINNGSELPPISDLLIGNIPGSIGETSKIAILIGAIILLWSGVASFKVMFSVFAGGISVAAVFHYFGHILPIDPFTFVMMGGFAFGAVFMATDPVTSSQTNAGKWIFGLLVGALAVVIRCLNPAYPEGMMMAILLMKTFIPLIDYIIVQNNKRKRRARAA